MLLAFLLSFASARSQNLPILSPGDTIAIVAPARGLTPQKLQPALDFFHSQGYHVLLGKNLFAIQGQYAGSDDQRASDFQGALDNPSVKVILCARGGYGSVRFIDQLDFSAFRRSPKWVCGFSDVTVFHSHLQALGFPSLHSVMPITIRADKEPNPYNESLMAALRGDSLVYEFAPSDSNRLGVAEGVVVGGNLSILYSLLGSVSDFDAEGKILFIEDTDEYLYHIDRMMRSLQRAGKLEGVRGLIVGCMNKLHDNDTPFGQDVENIIRTVCADYDFPICFDFPAGHCGRNFALRLGCSARLTVGEEGCSLVFPSLQ